MGTARVQPLARAASEAASVTSATIEVTGKVASVRWWALSRTSEIDSVSRAPSLRELL